MYYFILLVFGHVVLYSSEDIVKECGQGCKRADNLVGKFLQQRRSLRIADELVTQFDYKQL
jgi:hypothetical protein